MICGFAKLRASVFGLMALTSLLGCSSVSTVVEAPSAQERTPAAAHENETVSTDFAKKLAESLGDTKANRIEEVTAQLRTYNSRSQLTISSETYAALAEPPISLGKDASFNILDTFAQVLRSQAYIEEVENRRESTSNDFYEMKEVIKRANETFINSLGLVRSKIVDSKSDSARSILQLLASFGETASGKVSIQQATKNIFLLEKLKARLNLKMATTAEEAWTQIQTNKLGSAYAVESARDSMTQALKTINAELTEAMNRYRARATVLFAEGDKAKNNFDAARSYEGGRHLNYAAHTIEEYLDLGIDTNFAFKLITEDGLAGAAQFFSIVYKYTSETSGFTLRNTTSVEVMKGPESLISQFENLANGKGKDHISKKLFPSLPEESKDEIFRLLYTVSESTNGRVAKQYHFLRVLDQLLVGNDEERLRIYLHEKYVDSNWFKAITEEQSLAIQKIESLLFPTHQP